MSACHTYCIKIQGETWMFDLFTMLWITVGAAYTIVFLVDAKVFSKRKKLLKK